MHEANELASRYFDAWQARDETALPTPTASPRAAVAVPPQG